MSERKRAREPSPASQIRFNTEQPSSPPTETLTLLSPPGLRSDVDLDNEENLIDDEVLDVPISDSEGENLFDSDLME
ncbi:6490_t:CDS:2, partial [Acaulospora morrowiae]